MSWAKLCTQHCLTCHICRTISRNSKVGRQCRNNLTHPGDSTASVSLIGLGSISQRKTWARTSADFLPGTLCVQRDASNSPFLSLFLDTGAQEEKLESEKVHPERRPSLPALLRPCWGEVPWLLSPFTEKLCSVCELGPRPLCFDGFHLCFPFSVTLFYHLPCQCLSFHTP